MEEDEKCPYTCQNKALLALPPKFTRAEANKRREENKLTYQLSNCVTGTSETKLKPYFSCDSCNSVDLSLSFFSSSSTFVDASEFRVEIGN